MTDRQKFRLVLPSDWSEVNVYDIPGLIAATLEPNDGIEFSNIRQAAIEIEHEDQLRIAVESGDLVTRNRLTKIPEPFAIGEQLKRSVLLVEEFQEYVSQFGISVEVAEPRELLGRYNLKQAATNWRSSKVTTSMRLPSGFRKWQGIIGLAAPVLYTRECVCQPVHIC